LVIHGDEDLLLPYGNALALVDQLKAVPGNNVVELVKLSGCGHMFWDMDQETTLNAILDFINKVESNLVSKL
jgi:pimeloyl-ACP methyl ester carboxylesterase